MAADDSEKRIQEAITKFPIQKFVFERDTKKAMNACSFAIIGSSKSGKTTFLKYLLKTQFDDDIKLFMTQSPQNEIYDMIKKETAFAPAYIPDLIKTCYNINKYTKNKYPFCVIVDDVVGARQDRQMTKLLCLYRNSRMSAIVCAQDLTLLSPTGRANCNNVCLFKQGTPNRVEDNVKHFLRGYFPKNLNLDEKIELYQRLTEDHAFLWINTLENTITRCRLQSSQILD